MKPDFLKIMQEANKLQDKIKQAQSELKDLSITGQSGAGLVKITMNGTHCALNTSIDDSVLSNKEVLEELITAAINDCVTKISSQTKDKMNPFLSILNQ